MVLFLLCVKADIDNIAEIAFPEASQWCLDLQQSDGDEVKEGVYVCKDEESEIRGSKGVANFVMKFPGSNKEVTVNVITELKGKQSIRKYLEQDSGQFIPVVGFECRGVQPISWHPQTTCVVTTTGGSKFTDVNLEEKEWCEFDDDNELSVEIMDVQFQFIKAK